MKVSVLIATYNCAATIRQTLESVLRQSVTPHEILVRDDGSTDNTFEILRSYVPRITLMRQENTGVATVRNRLCEQASGDLLAFLDSDDLWHSSYLEVQSNIFEQHPRAVGLFTDHLNFRGYGDYDWNPASLTAQGIETISPLDFLRRYNQTTGQFGSMSYCCVPKRVISKLGKEPFQMSGVEDSFLCTLMPLYGPVMFAHTPLVVYRVTDESLSANRLKTHASWVQVFELLTDRYEKDAPRELRITFRSAFAANRRAYAKRLMGADKTKEAREQLWRSMGNSFSPASISKSAALFLLTYAPASVQPKWPTGHREIKDVDFERGSQKISQSL